MRFLRAFLPWLILGTLGAAPPSDPRPADKLVGLQKRYWVLAEREDAALGELRRLRAAFPSSADPEGLLLRRQALQAQVGALMAEGRVIRKEYRQGFTGLYIYQGVRLRDDIGAGMGSVTRLGGQILAFEKTADEMKAHALRFDEESRMEGERFRPLEWSYRAGKAWRRRALVSAASWLGGGVLVVGAFLARRRMAARPAPAALPQPTVGGFEPRGLIGRGTLGDVHEVFDPARGRRLALKLLRPELTAHPADLERLLAAARRLSALSHPNIAALHSIERDGAHVYLAYEFVEGKTVQRLLEERRPLDYGAALRVFRGTGAALQHAHAQGVSHRGLKPADIMVTGSNAVKVLDFAVVSEARRLLTGRDWAGAGGASPYMAPEQEQGKASPACDLYALSVIFYEVLTGELPFKGPDFPAQKRVGLHTPPSGLVPGLPRGLDAFFKVALAPRPSRRFASAVALAEAAKAAG